MDNLIEVNPFTDEFVKNEIAFMEYDIPESGIIEHEGITLKFREIQGRCDDYLNKQYRIDDWKTPVMFIDGTLWMSLSTMEVTSAFFGWWGMTGTVAMLGLGTGYTTLRCAAQDAVESVTVYERDPRVVEFFKHLHGTRPELDKITFVIGDAREELQGKDYDCAFADIYQKMLPEEVISDISHFLDNNDIGWYRFWGQEKVFLCAINEEIIPTYAIGMIDLDYLRHWQSTEGAQMFDGGPDNQYIADTIQAMGSYPEQMYIDNEVLDDSEDESCYG